MRQSPRLPSKCEDYFFNSSLNHTSQIFFHLCVNSLLLACVATQPMKRKLQVIVKFWKNGYSDLENLIKSSLTQMDPTSGAAIEEERDCV